MSSDDDISAYLTKIYKKQLDAIWIAIGKISIVIAGYTLLTPIASIIVSSFMLYTDFMAMKAYIHDKKIIKTNLLDAKSAIDERIQKAEKGKDSYAIKVLKEIDDRVNKLLDTY